MQQPVNGRRMPSTQRLRRDYSAPKIQPASLEIINYVCDSWNQVKKEERKYFPDGIPTGPSVRYYQPTEPDNRLADFEPFDLETWWGKKVYQNCQNRSS